MTTFIFQSPWEPCRLLVIDEITNHLLGQTWGIYKLGESDSVSVYISLSEPLEVFLTQAYNTGCLPIFEDQIKTFFKTF